MNHGELVAQFSMALAEIGNVLPRQQLNAALYPTPRLKEALSTVYAHIIKFLQQAVKWYKKSPAGRALSAVWKPFDLDLKSTVEQIQASSRTVDQIAKAASMAELRDVHLEVGDLYVKVGDLDSKIDRILNVALSTSNALPLFT